LINNGMGSGSSGSSKSGGSIRHLDTERDLAESAANGRWRSISDRHLVHQPSARKSNTKTIDEEEGTTQQISELPRQGSSSNSDRQDSPRSTTARGLPALVDQCLESHLCRKGHQEELRAQDLVPPQPYLEHKRLSSAINPMSSKLSSDHAIAWSLSWNGKRSKAGCAFARQAPKPGSYVATGTP
jgi:hypothetical protein